MAAAVSQAQTPIAEGVTPAQDAPNFTAPVTHSASLYVGDVDKEVTEAQLYDLFQTIGPVASIRVCRDAVTRRSLGYAYINYNSAVDGQAAERALEQLNYTNLNGKPLRIMWSHRDPSQRKSGVGNIFIKNLDKSIDHKALHDTFSDFGNILSCKVAVDANGVSKGHGFVHFESEESANKAIEKVNGMLLEGTQVFVGPFLKRSDRPDDKTAKFTNVYVKNFSENTEEKALTDLFSTCGTITSVIVMKDEEGKSKCFGFINFENPESAAEAVEKLNGATLDGKELWCGRAQKKYEREAELKQKLEDARQEKIAKYQGMNLYIKNLSDDVDDDKLRAEFAVHGTITSAKVMRDVNGKSRGFGFVCYTAPEEATRAVAESNGVMISGKPIYVALAQRKEVRKAQMEQQYGQPRMAPPVPGNPWGHVAPPVGMFPPLQTHFYPGRGMGPMNGPGMNPMYSHMTPRMSRGNGRGGRGGNNGPQMPFNGPSAPYGHGHNMYDGAGRNGRGRGGRGRDNRGRGQVGRGGRGQHQAPPTGPTAIPNMRMADDKFNASLLAAAHPEHQKQLLGENLFPLIHRQHPELAGKITGMLLEMDNSELLLLLDSQEALEHKVKEAISVLHQHQGGFEGGQGHMTEA